MLVNEMLQEKIIRCFTPQ